MEVSIGWWEVVEGGVCRVGRGCHQAVLQPVHPSSHLKAPLDGLHLSDALLLHPAPQVVLLHQDNFVKVAQGHCSSQQASHPTTRAEAGSSGFRSAIAWVLGQSKA